MTDLLLDGVDDGLGDLILSDDEFELLTEREQIDYLTVLGELMKHQPWRLQPKQAMAEWLSSQVDELLYGGAAGGGKSNWLLWHFHNLSLEHAGHESLLVRTSFPELNRTLIRRSILFFAKTPEPQRPVYKQVDKMWVYPNGSLLQFGYLDKFDDVYTYLSAEYDAIGVDELTLMDHLAYSMLTTRARTTVEKEERGIRPHIIGCTNPGGKAHGDVLNRFPIIPEDFDEQNIDVEQVKRVFNGKNGPEECTGYVIRQEVKMPDETVEHRSFGFVPANVADNAYMTRDYVKNLASQDAVTRAKYLEGDWTVFEGQYFKEFKRTRLVDPSKPPVQWHVVDQFDVPETWPRARGLDWGFGAPFCCLWAAWDPNGGMVIYRELYEKEVDVSDQARLIVEASKGEPRCVTVADKACWNRDAHGVSIVAQWQQAGLHGCIPSSVDRIGGWQKVRQYLEPMSTPDGPRPALRIMANCRNLIRTFPLMLHDDTKVEDLDTKLEDHALDALRFIIQWRPRQVVEKQPERAGIEGLEDKRLKALDKKRRRQ